MPTDLDRYQRGAFNKDLSVFSGLRNERNCHASYRAENVLSTRNRPFEGWVVGVLSSEDVDAAVNQFGIAQDSFPCC